MVGGAVGALCGVALLLLAAEHALEHAGRLAQGRPPRLCTTVMQSATPSVNEHWLVFDSVCRLSYGIRRVAYSVWHAIRHTSVCFKSR